MHQTKLIILFIAALITTGHLQAELTPVLSQFETSIQHEALSGKLRLAGYSQQYLKNHSNTFLFHISGTPGQTVILCGQSQAAYGAFPSKSNKDSRHYVLMAPNAIFVYNQPVPALCRESKTPVTSDKPFKLRIFLPPSPSGENITFCPTDVFPDEFDSYELSGGYSWETQPPPFKKPKGGGLGFQSDDTLVVLITPWLLNVLSWFQQETVANDYSTLSITLATPDENDITLDIPKKLFLTFLADYEHTGQWHRLFQWIKQLVSGRNQLLNLSLDLLSTMPDQWMLDHPEQLTQLSSQLNDLLDIPEAHFNLDIELNWLSQALSPEEKPRQAFITASRKNKKSANKKQNHKKENSSSPPSTTTMPSLKSSPPDADSSGDDQRPPDTPVHTYSNEFCRLCLGCCKQRKPSPVPEGTGQQAPTMHNTISLIASDLSQPALTDDSEGEEFYETSEPKLLRLKAPSGGRSANDLVKICQQAQDTSNEYNKLKSTHNEGRKDRDFAAKVFHQATRLQNSYYKYLKQHPEEKAWLEQKTRNFTFDSPSDWAWFEMHTTILRVVTHDLTSIPFLFEVFDDILSYYLRAFTGSAPLQISPYISSALDSLTMSESMARQVELFHLNFAVSPPDNNPLSDEVRAFAQYITNMGKILLQLHGHPQVFNPDTHLVDIRTAIIECAETINITTELILDHFKNEEEQTLMFINTQLRFMFFTHHPSTFSKILASLNALTGSGRQSGFCEPILEILALLTEKLVKFSQTSDTFLPIVSHLFFMKENGWLQRQLKSSNTPWSNYLEKMLGALREATGSLYPQNGTPFPEPCKKEPKDETYPPEPPPSQATPSGITSKAVPRITDRLVLKKMIFSLPFFHSPETSKRPDQEKEEQQPIKLNQLPKLAEEARQLVEEYDAIVKLSDSKTNIVREKLSETSWYDRAGNLKKRIENISQSFDSLIKMVLTPPHGQKGKKEHEKLTEAHRYPHLLASALHRFSDRSLFSGSSIYDACAQYLQNISASDSKERLSGITYRLQEKHRYYARDISLPLQSLALTPNAGIASLNTNIALAASKMLSVMYDDLVLLQKIQHTHHYNPPSKQLAEALQQVLFTSPVAQNLALLFDIWPSSDKTIGSSDLQKLLCIKLILRPNDTLQTLSILDSTHSPESVHPLLLHRVFLQLNSLLHTTMQEITLVTSALDQLAHLNVMQHVAHSLQEGWLHRQWFYYVATWSGHIPFESDLLLTISRQADFLKSKLATSQKQLSEEFKDNASIQKTAAKRGKKIKKTKARGTIKPSETRSLWYEDPIDFPELPKPALKQKSDHLPKLIRDNPAKAIKIINDRLETQKEPSLVALAKLQRSEAALNQIEPLLTRIIGFHDNVDKFANMLQEALLAENYRFGDGKFYSQMVQEFDGISKTLSQLNKVFSSALAYIECTHNITATPEMDDTAVEIHQEKCRQLNPQIARTLPVIERMDECMQLRKRHNASLNSLRHKMPEHYSTAVFKEVSKALDDTRKELSALQSLTNKTKKTDDLRQTE